ncbi:elongation factor Ts [Candidatus Hakubella thermalkaliphila]|uniref:Elongation factor Ts n=1 Tax=Candidatus Hakubella thermalkaliphila TaxID=2754717 RepID=A0A6V8PYI0_9ACTN|nr:translation elongation factor Ts [Candidatus Hakubella thermalkaliphila]GFP25350.1 elongation factor Ts [Candidatus Hakubella thermalkaliphila]GFP28143.1 elongation factor Ts [Candidatus Hakubella thermalkaliphila]GFP35781.1 elongation factor Ts [Candidatus Hakubella thermalkaliphila]
MSIEASLVKKLREISGAGVMDCKRALEETQGDVEKAVLVLRKKGISIAQKKSSHLTNEGLIDAYVHQGGRIGVLVEVNCETDFVARNEEFRAFVHDLALHIAASNPLFVSCQDVPDSLLSQEKEIYRKQALSEGKKENVVEKIVEGKTEKFYEEICLLDQPFIRDPEKTVEQLLIEMIARMGENIEIRRFTRYQLGESV